jgi:hypothetical protein
MPQLCALIYNYRDELKTYHKIKAKLFTHGSAQWGKVRLSQPIVPASQRKGLGFSAERAEQKDVFTYVGSFKWRFLGPTKPEAPADLELFYNKHGRQGAPSGWLLTGENYYSWFQIPETIVHVLDRQELESIARVQQMRELLGRVQDAQVLKEAQDEHKEDVNYDTGSSAGDKSWALKRAKSMWTSLEDEHEQAATKRMKYQTTMGGA